MRTSLVALLIAGFSLCAPVAWAETVPVWWSASLAGPAAEDLEAAFEAPFGEGGAEFTGPQGSVAAPESCAEAADLLTRGFKAPRDQGIQAARCLALAKTLYAAEAETTLFRLPIADGAELVPGGAPRPLEASWLMQMPALLAPQGTCAMKVLGLRASGRFWSLARFAHVYGRGEGDDGRDAQSISSKVEDAATGKLIAVFPSGQRVQLLQNGQNVQIDVLALADFNADGVEDALVLHQSAEGAELFTLTQYRPGAIMSAAELGAHYQRVLAACPDLTLALARETEMDTGTENAPQESDND